MSLDNGYAKEARRQSVAHSEFERPAFEVTDLKGKHYKIYASGRTEGFEDCEPCVIVNRIPQISSEV